MTKPAYFNPEFFKRGEKVTYSGFPCTVVRHYAEGMWEVRLSSGITCVTGAHLIKV